MYTRLAILVIAFSILSGCVDNSDIFEFEFETMGTVAGGIAYSYPDAGQLVEATFDSVNTTLSSWTDDSELGALNLASVDQKIIISSWLNNCLTVSEEIHRNSGGAFDPTAGPLMRLWGFYRRQGHLPSETEIDSCLALLGGYEHNQNSVTKTHAETKFDFGGIAKGFAVDRAVANLKAEGMKNGLIDLGGNIYCLGSPKDRNYWSVGIKDPLNKNRIVARVEMSNKAIATSGAYERFVEIDGVRYGHIMNPVTGKPATGLLSATVIADSGIIADGLSTALFVLGPEKARELLKNYYQEVEAILIIQDKEKARILVTPGLRGDIELLEEYRDRYLISSFSR